MADVRGAANPALSLVAKGDRKMCQAVSTSQAVLRIFAGHAFSPPSYATYLPTESGDQS
jgi:hypothetical protein